MELMMTVMLHKMGDTEWTEEELSPIKEIELINIMPSYAPLGATITLLNGKKYVIDFVNIDGNRTC